MIITALTGFALYVAMLIAVKRVVEVADYSLPREHERSIDQLI